MVINIKFATSNVPYSPKSEDLPSFFDLASNTINSDKYMEGYYSKSIWVACNLDRHSFETATITASVEQLKSYITGVQSHSEDFLNINHCKVSFTLDGVVQDVYYFITTASYVGDNVIKFKLVLDYWATYWPLIDLAEDRELFVKRRHLDRFKKKKNKILGAFLDLPRLEVFHSLIAGNIVDTFKAPFLRYKMYWEGKDNYSTRDFMFGGSYVNGIAKGFIENPHWTSNLIKAPDQYNRNAEFVEEPFDWKVIGDMFYLSSYAKGSTYNLEHVIGNFRRTEEQVQLTFTLTIPIIGFYADADATFPEMSINMRTLSYQHKEVIMEGGADPIQLNFSLGGACRLIKTSNVEGGKALWIFRPPFRDDITVDAFNTIYDGVSYLSLSLSMTEDVFASAFPDVRAITNGIPIFTIVNFVSKGLVIGNFPTLDTAAATNSIDTDALEILINIPIYDTPPLEEDGTVDIDWTAPQLFINDEHTSHFKGHATYNDLENLTAVFKRAPNGINRFLTNGRMLEGKSYKDALTQNDFTDLQNLVNEQATEDYGKFDQGYIFGVFMLTSNFQQGTAANPKPNLENKIRTEDIGTFEPFLIAPISRDDLRVYTAFGSNMALAYFLSPFPLLPDWNNRYINRSYQLNGIVDDVSDNTYTTFESWGFQKEAQDTPGISQFIAEHYANITSYNRWVNFDYFFKEVAYVEPINNIQINVDNLPWDYTYETKLYCSQHLQMIYKNGKDEKEIQLEKYLYEGLSGKIEILFSSYFDGLNNLLIGVLDGGLYKNLNMDDKGVVIESKTLLSNTGNSYSTYMQNHLNSYNTAKWSINKQHDLGTVGNMINGVSGIIGGAAKAAAGMAVGAAAGPVGVAMGGMSGLGQEFMSGAGMGINQANIDFERDAGLRKIASKVNDLKNNPLSIKNLSNEMNIGLLKGQPSRFKQSRAVHDSWLYPIGLSKDERITLAMFYHQFGYEYNRLQGISKSVLCNNRLRFNYWQIDNFRSIIQDINNPNGKFRFGIQVKEWFNKLFSNGVRLWNTDTSTKYTINYCDYSLENWETGVL